MIVLNLTSTHENRRLMLVLSTNFAIHEPSSHHANSRVGCIIADGVHNNGGWQVQETRDEVIAMLTPQSGQVARANKINEEKTNA